jgi:hypothetical protein
VFVILRAAALPLRTLLCQITAVNSFMSIANLTRLLLPDSAVTGILANQSMGDFVKQHLLNLIQIGICQQVF